MTILEVMAEAIDAPDEMSPYAPRITTIKVPVDKIGEVIGPKGKMINSITEETGAEIAIEDDGTVFVAATDGSSAQAAIDRINAIANPQLPKVGERFLGTVVKTTAFGAFVSLLPGRDGLVHISKLGSGKRIAKVEDVVNVGDKLQVEIAEIDARGKISLVPSPRTTTPRRLLRIRLSMPRQAAEREGGPAKGPPRQRVRPDRRRCAGPPCPVVCASSPNTSRRSAPRPSVYGSASVHATRDPASRAHRISWNTCCSRPPRRAAPLISRSRSTPSAVN